MTSTRSPERLRCPSSVPPHRWQTLLVAASVFLVLGATMPAVAQVTGRSVLESLEFEPLDFQQPVVEERNVLGVDVLLLEDDALPLVTLHAYFRGGYARFPRSSYAAATGLPALLRYGGTVDRTPQEVDERIAHLALQTSFGTGGGSITSSMNTLTEHLVVATELWGDMLVAPGFDEGEVEAWRARQVESVRRRADDPGRLAVAEMNRLLYGDHPVGWEMTTDDLQPARVTPGSFRRVHRGIVCRENLVLGFTGDVDWARAKPLAESLVGRIPACGEELAEEPTPEIRRAPGVFVVEKPLEQAVVVMAHPTNVRLADDNQYFAALIGNSILGGGGFSSRILQRVRTDEGYAYSATSLWTTPRRHEGLIGAMTRTRPENVAPAIDVILATMRGLLDGPPRADEVDTTVDQIINGFVFNFESASQVVSRTMYYRAIDLPDDWLERYWDGVQQVGPADVFSVFRDHLRPDEMTILIVGDPERIGLEALERLGPVEMLVPGQR
ncbi:MAG: insulinase family protein [Gemmatimonadetes bacterium]|nr:insulinase family protein [Gemmatimonadota bacterium]NNL29388.1 insulinase family protein [Gemmatimonadota bacterium]